MCTLPDRCQLVLCCLQLGCTSPHPTTQYYMQITEEVGWLPDRPSAHPCEPKTRPLDVKLEQVCEKGEAVYDHTPGEPFMRRSHPVPYHDSDNQC
jgi:hypothetical protein